MIDEHEIPKGSRLYFGKSAQIKRRIENCASEVLVKNGFEEIVTPFFSYHQHKHINEKELIRFSDEQNHLVSLRSDSTLDVVRLISKRLEGSTKQSKWFYIQPVFHFPSLEINQIGAEFIGETCLVSSITNCKEIFAAFDLHPLVHISNIKIPKLIAKELGLDIGIFERSELQKILSLNIPWLEQLACLQHPVDIDAVMAVVPRNIKEELAKMKDIYTKIAYQNVHMAPLYYVNMRYYDALFFRFIDKNSTLAMGGSYIDRDVDSTGFALYTDALIEAIRKE